MKKSRVIFWLSLVSIIEAFISLAILLAIPADPKNAFLWGYSVSRLSVAALFLIFVGLLTYLSYNAVIRPAEIEKSLNSHLSSNRPRRITGAFLSIIAILAWVFLWLPSYRFGTQASLMERIFPIVLWLGLVSFQALIVLMLWVEVLQPREIWQSLRSQGSLWGSTLLGMIVLLLGWVIAYPMGLLKQDDLYFNAPGAPITGLQLLGGWLFACLALILIGLAKNRFNEENNQFWKQLDWSLVLLIWLVATWVWIRTPMRSTFLAPGPYPPDNAVYPLVDTALYDRTAQFALMGLGLNNGQYVDKPLYASFLTMLHIFAGQDFNLLTSLQTLVLAGIPAMAYVLGKKLYGRAAGLIAALLIILHGVNAIAGGHLIQTAHPRLLLSETPLALTMVFLAIWIVGWIQNPKDPVYPILAGGTLGLSTLIRHNPWLLLPIIILFTLLANWKRWKRWLGQAALFCLMLFAVISPWMVYSQKTIGTPWYFTIPLRGTVWQQRYLPEFEGNSLLPQQWVPHQVALSPVPVATGGSIIFSKEENNSSEQLENGLGVIVRFIAAHFINNFNSTIFIFPTHLPLDNLEHTLSSPDSVWRQAWEGNVSIIFALNLFILVLGVSLAWRKWRFAGITPLMIYFGYLLALAVARTSGGRYITPVDWVLILYYAIGMVQIIAWLLGKKSAIEDYSIKQIKSASSWRLISAIASIFLVVGMIPLAQEAFPANIPPTGVDAIPSDQWLAEKNIQAQEVSDFLDQEGAEILSGRIIFPRQYQINQGDHNECYVLKGYPRLVFELLNEDGVHCVILPYDKPIENVTLQAANAVVLNCSENTAWAVFVPELDLALTRSPSVDFLQCPLPEPVCDDNRNCK